MPVPAGVRRALTYALAMFRPTDRQLSPVWSSAGLVGLLLADAGCPADAPIDPTDGSTTQAASSTGMPPGTTTTLDGTTTSGPDPDSGSSSSSDATTTASSTGSTGEATGSGTTTDTSSSSSEGEGSSSTGPAVVCGDDMAEDMEVCDGTDLSGQTCSSQGFAAGGILECQPGCAGFDTSGCFGGECCMESLTPGCDDAGCTAAVCSFIPECCNVQWDLFCAVIASEEPACMGLPGCPECGNGIVENGFIGSEECDGAGLDGETCLSQGYAGGGMLGCQADCTFDTTGCMGPQCGDNVIDPGEVCDGIDVGGEDCVTQGASFGGMLGCLSDCSGYDTSMCYAGDCCSQHIEPGCDSEPCTNAVCAIEPLCCDFAWIDPFSCPLIALAEPACVGAGGSCPP